MLEVFTKISCSILMLITGFIIIKKITNDQIKLVSFKNLLVIIISTVFQCMLYDSDYRGMYTLLIYILNIMTYKMIFKKSISETTILTSIVMILSFVGDLVNGIVLRLFISMEAIRELSYVMILSTLVVSIYSVILISFKKVSSFLKHITTKINNIKFINSLIFIILLITFLIIISNSLYINKGWNINFLIDILIITIFIALFIIYTNERNSYNNLTKKYDELFDYVQNFEELIEKEQLNRHEYKNQLAVIRCLSKEKKVKEKIDEILEDNINIEDNVLGELKYLPKGGIKGLMYYKAAVAKKNKINLTATVSLNSKTILSKLSESKIKVICKLIGIYLDNAIEASRETKKKIILIEVYELKDRVNFVFSNTFKKHQNFDKRNEKGVSSKGEGRGNGLYFANKILERNDYLEQKQEVIDNYYIQQLIIKKKNTSKK